MRNWDFRVNKDLRLWWVLILFFFLCLQNSWAWLALGEDTAETDDSDLLALQLASSAKDRHWDWQSLCAVYLGHWEENPFFISCNIIVPCRSTGTRLSLVPEGEGEHCQRLGWFLSQLSANSKETDAVEAEGEGCYPRATTKGGEPQSLGREGCRVRFRDVFVGEVEMGWRTSCFLGAWWPWSLGQDKPVGAKIHTWSITIS